jgi:D-serine deaminase-like pyridoxal phosphate-dependent protein
MRSRFKILVIAGSRLTAALSASAAAAATTVPVMDTPTFACGNGAQRLRVAGRGILTETNPGSITLKDSLGGSVTIPLTVNTKYS